MNKLYSNISSRKDFKCPPILPHFQYQLVTLHDISNTDLLAKGDEISLAMLNNKIQTPEDMSAFINLPGKQVDNILEIPQSICWTFFQWYYL